MFDTWRIAPRERRKWRRKWRKKSSPREGGECRRKDGPIFRILRPRIGGVVPNRRTNRRRRDIGRIWFVCGSIRRRLFGIDRRYPCFALPVARNCPISKPPVPTPSHPLRHSPSSKKRPPPKKRHASSPTPPTPPRTPPSRTTTTSDTTPPTAPNPPTESRISIPADDRRPVGHRRGDISEFARSSLVRISRGRETRESPPRRDGSECLSGA
mmetsp:Transcript_3495/g.7057  ORF Transcript_3495/g.7057 Transcript_3495/m.7057 type:complete len:212 (-) Transcript_3495:842-1477(-)